MNYNTFNKDWFGTVMFYCFGLAIFLFIMWPVPIVCDRCNQTLNSNYIYSRVVKWVVGKQYHKECGKLEITEDGSLPVLDVEPLSVKSDWE